MKKKNNSSLWMKESDAVAGIIVAVMLLGLMISVISIIQMVYVPKWMEEREAEHMGVVANQMSQFKYSIDTLTASQQKTPITSSITLGSKELGFLSSSRAFGHIQLVADAFTIQIYRTSDGGTGELNFKTFTYTSENSYFLNQKYTYEAGALILSQAEGNVLLNAPSISLQEIDGNRVEMTWNGIHIQEESKSSVGGYGTIPLRMTYASVNNQSDELNSVIKISIKTTYPLLWKQYFTRALTADGFIEQTDDPNSPEEFQIVELTPSGIDINFNNPSKLYLDLFITTINLQIGPGWVQ